MLGENHPDTLATIANLANTYQYQGRYEEAEILYKQCLDKQRVLLGENHPNTLLMMRNLSSTIMLKKSHGSAS